MANNEGKSKHSCIRCGKQIKHDDLHIRTCKLAIEDVDYVRCKICNERFVALYVHCKKHGLTSDEYEKQYGKLMCSETEKRVSERNTKTQQKSNYRNKLKSDGKFDELRIYNQTVGEKVSKTILANAELRETRTNTLAALNKTDEFRKRASDAAKKTSARKEIQERRAEVLKKWREENPEKFLQIQQSMHRFSSKPEKELLHLMQFLYPDWNFKQNQQLNRKNVFKISRSGIKQIDVFSKQNKIILEFDGEFHFENIEKWNQLELVHKKDIELNSLKDEFCIIRISYDQFSYRTSDYGFSQKCKETISKILQDPKPGLHLIGNAYAKDNIN